MMRIMAKTNADLDREHGDPLRSVDVVPHTQVASVLPHHHITTRHPLYIGAVVEDGGARLARYVVHVKLKPYKSNIVHVSMYMPNSMPNSMPNYKALTYSFISNFKFMSGNY